MKTMAEVIFSHLDETGDEYDLRYSAAVRRLATDVERELLAAGFGPVKAERETVTEWAAAFPQTGNVYNFHRTREEAQAFVDGMREVGADMVVMTREVLPQDASDWRVAGEAVTARDLLGIAPDFTGGLSVDEYMDEQRGRGNE